MKFGKILKELRENHNLRQGDLAKYMNVDRSTIGKWENGSSTPDYEKLVKLGDYFNVSVDYLIGRTNIKNPESKEFEKLAHKEIKTVEDALEIIKHQDGLMLKGKVLNDEDKMLLANALQLGMKYVLEQEEKKKKENK